jgi:hypothetical protein
LLGAQTANTLKPYTLTEVDAATVAARRVLDRRKPLIYRETVHAYSCE